VRSPSGEACPRCFVCSSVQRSAASLPCSGLPRASSLLSSTSASSELLNSSPLSVANCDAELCRRRALSLPLTQHRPTADQRERRGEAVGRAHSQEQRGEGGGRDPALFRTPWAPRSNLREGRRTTGIRTVRADGWRRDAPCLRKLRRRKASHRATVRLQDHCLRYLVLLCPFP